MSRLIHHLAACRAFAARRSGLRLAQDPCAQALQA